MKSEKNEKLLSSIFNVGRLVREELCKGKRPADFTQVEIEVLKFVGNNGSTTMKSVADHLHIKPSSATPIIDNLVKKANLKRVKNKSDRREVYINLTRKGSAALQKKYRDIHKIVTKIFDKLSEKDSETLIKIFNKIDENNK